MHLPSLLITTLLSTLTLSSPTPLEPKSSHISIILTTLSGGPANYTLALIPNTKTPTSNALSISKIYSQNRSLNLLSDCEFFFNPAPAHAAKPEFVREVDGSVTVSKARGIGGAS
ncbi:hypothetical protein HII31_04002 [Pseudocercospora fuligena]|uniref:Uncharacterized protein n=1 Tax=Pseudocercospora fuligena TaxID=685502 RepID=A0A8H6VK80_9PEZI|nr:hypothetical protein HII31_04002 [Pseudocercospora fuligena]